MAGQELSQKATFNESQIETVLAEDIHFKGTLRFKNSLLIKGQLKGEIHTEAGHLLLGETSKVNATIKANRISSRGDIIGNVEAREKMELFAGASLNGDIITPDLMIESGVHFNGNCTMNKFMPH